MNKITCMLLLTGTILLSCSGSQNNNKQPKKETGMKTIELTKEEFLKNVANYKTNLTEWKYLGDKPAIIDFYADWCVPCKMMTPILEELATEYDGKIYVYKVNVEKEQELAAAFGIQIIPSLLFTPMNNSPQMSSGAMSKLALKQIIDDVLLK